ncbi:peptidoglycan DD-metalloendopeptidase family protein [Plectonema cf. radiosum LEGE 06105]|uniref:Peptidoglycan DD-metalloendopeptidase family protein n=1 Tax=Plectonema cf. radiosum LEGE 06105 TaxID=945769 RepID=A0A8J7K4X2_9CYAN|nr:M23 family metallopeptidase [Plectonema radiosum]MBE9216562.1 peptidoglycan DD-metalloendopeptidase family protein [Plectonema cf. radiosum LEGE 06105]
MRALFPQQHKIYLRLPIVFCGVLCILLILTPVFSVQGQGSSKQTIDQLKQQRKQIQQTHQNTVVEKNRLNSLQQEAEKRLGGLQENLRTTDSQIQDTEKRLEIATQRLEQLQADLATAEVSYAQRQTSTVARLKFLQRCTTSQGWAVLLQSRNLNDFLSRRRNLKLIYQADQKVLAKLTQEANRIIQQKTDIEGKKNEIALIRQQLLAQKADYQGQSELQTELVQRLNSDRLALDAARLQLEKDSQSIAILINQKVAEQQAAIAAAKARSQQRDFVSGSGIMALPSNGYISSPYGWRSHPLLGYRRLHTGIDFAAGYGSTIRAADSGTVIYSGWYGGYGKTVIINHGKGITTLYAHSSQLYVQVGESVKRGQAISAIGSTGLSTGPHLHFEVRKNGTPVNPADYL